MKKIIYILSVIGGLIFSLGSCVDLDKNALVNPNKEIFYQTEKEALNGITAAYSDLKDYRYTWTLWCLGDVLSDDATYSGSDADVTSYARMEAYDYPVDNGRILDRYRIPYRAINKACQALEGIEKMDASVFADPQTKDRMLGEMLFLRGYMYHELVKAFGGVPVITTTLGMEDRNKTRASVEEVYTQIEKDLNDAADVLPTYKDVDKSTYAGRATKGAAYAMLTRVYLYQKKYDEVKTVAKKLFDLNEYELVPEYADQFKLSGENSSESILEINHYDSPNQSAATQNNGNFHVLMMMPFGATYGYGINQPSQDLAKAFDEIGDTKRKDATLLTNEDILREEGEESYKLLERNRTGYYNEKYYLPPNERSVEIRNNPMNIKLIRLAEVYLNYAEACAKTGEDGEAQAYLKKLRDRVGLPAITSTGDQLYTDIIKERRLELAMEGFRFWDVIRVGWAPTLFKGFKQGRDEILPIPQDEIDKTNGMITQNPR